MKLNDAREFYYFYSGKTSDVVRQLGIAGIAVIWLFKKDINNIPKIPAELIPALWLITIGLGFDLFQYATSSLIWGIYQRRQEKNKIGEEKEFRAPDWFNRPAIMFMILKCVSIVIAFIIIITFLLNVIV